ncbi:MAG TPA: YecR family lipoprotein [Steroidobacter sp.]|uniref:YecR family lipoprotein n=1 Tax=Steroidobacter sp. TaxID=1978227 RepID=UPI002ED8986A
MKQSLLALAFIAMLPACAVQKTLVPTGGSRSDGTVELSYDVRMFETAKVDFQQGATVAAQRCQAWGYSDAQAFGGQKTHCHQYNGYGSCLNATVSVQYQCIGANKPQ